MITIVDIWPENGSSPRTWGRQIMSPPSLFQHRFIPTHVGQTFDLYSVISLCTGSSPRTWGRLVKPVYGFAEDRFIPTHVGQTWVEPFLKEAVSVHPHARGADYTLRFDKLLLYRFIPTHVGQTGLPRKAANGQFGSSPRTWGRRLSRRSFTSWWPVHPHARGADGRVPCAGGLPCGSSPRTWGRLGCCR